MIIKCHLKCCCHLTKLVSSLHQCHYTHVTVPCRNRRWFRCIFWLHHCVQSAVSLNFRKGRAHTCFVDSLAIHASTKHVWALPIADVQWYGTFKHSDVIEIRDGIIFDFYMGLSHIQVPHSGLLIQNPVNREIKLNCKVNDVFHILHYWFVAFHLVGCKYHRRWDSAKTLVNVKNMKQMLRC